MSLNAFRWVLLVSLVVAINGCGGPDCGPGTLEVGDKCVAASGVACGPGTQLSAETGACIPTGTGSGCGAGTVFSEMLGQCVPDGAVVCTGNTVWDEEMEQCVVDESACVEGTVLVMGKCVPFDETLMGDFQELAEPNDPSLLDDAGAEALIAQLQAAAISLPEVGQSTTIKGCIDPEKAWGTNPEMNPPAADSDFYALNAPGPSVIRVRLSALGGLAAGFTMDPAENQAQGWFRAGINLRADDVERELYMPASGTYFFTVGDARNLLSQQPLPVGGPDACYFVEIERIALPTPTAATLGMEYTGPSDKVHSYTLTGSEAQFMLGEVGASDPEIEQRPIMALTALVNNSHRESVNEGQGGSALSFVPSLADGDAVTFVVDHAFNTARGFDTFAFTPSELGTTALPDNGNVTVTMGAQFPNAFYFEGTGGDLENIVASMGSVDDDERPEADIIVIDPFGFNGGTVCQGCSEADAWVSTHANGYYYVIVFVDGAEEGDTQEVSFAHGSATPTAFAVGETKSIDLSTQNKQFFTTDFAGSEWLKFMADNKSNIDNVSVDFFDLEPMADRSAVLEEDFRAAILQRFGTTPGTDTAGRVTIDDERKFLVAFSNTDEATGDESFDFTIENREFEDMGMLTAATPFAAKDYSVDAEDTLYFLGRAVAASTMTPTATPTAGDVVIRRLDIVEMSDLEVNDAGAGDPETTSIAMDEGSDLVIFAVDVTGETGDVNFKVDVLDPPYTQAGGSKAFTDICGSGTALTFTDGFSTPVDIAAAGFSFFGAPESQVLVSDQGWLTFDTTYADDSAIFDSFPVLGTSVVAPFATFLDTDVEVCYELGASKVTFQWSGFDSFFGGGAQVQAVLNANGTIDFIYGPNHPGSFFQEIGLESQDGSFGLNRTEPVLPGSSVTWTPAGL